MTELEKLTSNVALVTGASSNIGKAIALRLAVEGCDLHLADANETLLEDMTSNTPENFSKFCKISKVDSTRYVCLIPTF